MVRHVVRQVTWSQLQAIEDGSVASGRVRGLAGSHWGHMDDDGAWEMLRGEEIAKDR